MHLVKPGTNIDFVGKRHMAGVASVIMVVASIVLFFVVGPNWGIDFTGGTEVHLKFNEATEIGDVRAALTELELSNDAVQQIGAETDYEYVIRIQDPEFGAAEMREEVETALSSAFGPEWIEDTDYTAEVGARLTVRYSGPQVHVNDVQAAVDGVDGAKAQPHLDDKTVFINLPGLSTRIRDILASSIKGKLSDDTVAAKRAEVEAALAAEFDAGWATDVATKWSGDRASLVIAHAGSDKDIDAVRGALLGVPGARVLSYDKLGALSVELEHFSVLQVDSVGPKVGGELREQGFIALATTLALVLVYVGFRFEMAFAPGAVLALFHDVVIVIGIFTVTRHEFNLPMIGALLTIIGYSLNDTIVIYDRIRENSERYRRKDMDHLINGSINETLARTLATSITTAAAMTAFLTLGGPVIETFALAILLGVLFGTYSTVFVASPTILVMQDLRPHLERLLTPRAVAAAEAASAEGQTSTERRRMEREANQDIGA